MGFYVGYDSASRTVLVDTNRSAEFNQNQLERKKEIMIKFGTSLVGKVSYEDVDCSQFVGAIIDYAGINLQVPPWTWTIGSSPALEEIPMSELKRGDILNRSDRPNQHVMIYIGNGQILESVPKLGVRIGKLRTEGYTAYRFISY
ncbi:MAG: C40 family peptidase [Tissierellia bacterium]|nr:C40 family peptidase [Tissierellia bacterium]